jgi:hypothetical protein
MISLFIQFLFAPFVIAAAWVFCIRPEFTWATSFGFVLIVLTVGAMLTYGLVIDKPQLKSLKKFVGLWSTFVFSAVAGACWSEPICTAMLCLLAGIVFWLVKPPRKLMLF